MGTSEFANAVVANLGKKPKQLEPVAYQAKKEMARQTHSSTATQRNLVGIDVFIYHKGKLHDFLAKIQHINVGPLRLKMITNRGVRIWPEGQPETVCIEQWRCRFLTDEGRATVQHEAIGILQAFDRMELDVIKSEFLFTFDGKPGYSSSEG